jgi:hypothetical protein
MQLGIVFQQHALFGAPCYLWSLGHLCSIRSLEAKIVRISLTLFPPCHDSKGPIVSLIIFHEGKDSRGERDCFVDMSQCAD